MKIFNTILSIMLLCTTNSIFTARPSSRTSARTKERTPTKKPTRTPITRQKPPIQQQSEREEQLIKYDDILVFLKEKAPNSSDLSMLQNIKTEVNRQIDLIESPTELTLSREQEIAELEKSIAQKEQTLKTIKERRQKK